MSARSGIRPVLSRNNDAVAVPIHVLGQALRLAVWIGKRPQLAAMHARVLQRHQQSLPRIQPDRPSVSSFMRFLWPERLQLLD